MDRLGMCYWYSRYVMIMNNNDCVVFDIDGTLINEVYSPDKKKDYVIGIYLFCLSGVVSNV